MKGKTFYKLIEADKNMIWRGARQGKFADQASIRIGHKKTGVTFEITAAGVIDLTKSEFSLMQVGARECDEFSGVRRVLADGVEFPLAWTHETVAEVLNKKYPNREDVEEDETEAAEDKADARKVDKLLRVGNAGDPKLCAFCGKTLRDGDKIAIDVAGTMVGYCGPDCIDASREEDDGPIDEQGRSPQHELGRDECDGKDVEDADDAPSEAEAQAVADADEAVDAAASELNDGDAPEETEGVSFVNSDMDDSGEDSTEE